ncbi:hypothetical protein OROGR_028866 [Orobanche gracilis]
MAIHFSFSCLFFLHPHFFHLLFPLSLQPPFSPTLYFSFLSSHPSPSNERAPTDEINSDHICCRLPRSNANAASFCVQFLGCIGASLASILSDAGELLVRADQDE